MPTMFPAPFGAPVRRPPSRLPRWHLAAVLLGIGALQTAAAQSQPPTVASAAAPAAPAGIVRLASSATLEVATDVMTLTLGTTRDGPDAASVQAQLKQALDAALAEARRASRPGQLEVQTGNFSLAPRYGGKGGPSGGITGWQGTTELIIEGRDMAAIGELAGRIGTLAILRVGYSLSRELRERSEGELSAQAIARFRARAADIARQFGFAAAEVVEVSVSSVDGTPPSMRPMMRMAAALAPGAGEPLAVEPGKGSITVSVDGSVRLTR